MNPHGLRSLPCISNTTSSWRLYVMAKCRPGVATKCQLCPTDWHRWHTRLENNCTANDITAFFEKTFLRSDPPYQASSNHLSSDLMSHWLFQSNRCSGRIHRASWKSVHPSNKFDYYIWMATPISCPPPQKMLRAQLHQPPYLDG